MTFPCPYHCYQTKLSPDTDVKIKEKRWSEQATFAPLTSGQEIVSVPAGLMVATAQE